jgi:uncharacterized membrane protein YraQ (UPF0718 family)
MNFYGFEIIPIFGFWAAIGTWLATYGTAVAGVATAVGAGYSIYAAEDSKRRQKNAVDRAEKQQAAALEAAQTQEEIFNSLQNLNGYETANDLTAQAKAEQQKRVWIYVGIAVAVLGGVWFYMKKRRRK